MVKNRHRSASCLLLAFCPPGQAPFHLGCSSWARLVVFRERASLPACLQLLPTSPAKPPPPPLGCPVASGLAYPQSRPSSAWRNGLVAIGTCYWLTAAARERGAGVHGTMRGRGKRKDSHSIEKNRLLRVKEVDSEGASAEQPM